MSEQVKILVAEHDTPLAMLMISVLTQEGCDVKAVNTGKKAMALGAERKFDIIILETDLPDITGYEIYRDLKQRHISWKTPIVFVSANATIENQQYALDLGAADFIEKPFDVSDFASRILSLIQETATA
jgi:DNA-binding response OmpR family regulator